jgi:hypothetical protein
MHAVAANTELQAGSPRRFCRTGGESESNIGAGLVLGAKAFALEKLVSLVLEVPHLEFGVELSDRLLLGLESAPLFISLIPRPERRSLATGCPWRYAEWRSPSGSRLRIAGESPEEEDVLGSELCFALLGREHLLSKIKCALPGCD